MKANQYVVFNAITMNLKTILIILISFLSSRFLLQALGVEGFGLYSLIVGISATLEFVCSGISSTTSRYTILALGKHSLEYSREVFNTLSRANNKLIIWFLAILEVFGMIMILYVLDLPRAKIITSIVIFQIMVLDTYYKFKVIPYNSVLLAKENFLFINVLAIIVALLRLGFIGLLFIVPYNRIIIYATIMFFLSYLSRLITKRFTTNRYPEAHLDEMKYFNISLQNEVFSFLRFSWIGQVAPIIKRQGTGFLLNLFSGGVIYNASYSAAVQVASLSDMAFSPIAGTILPQTLKGYSEGNVSRFKNLTFFNAKLSILFSWIFIIPLLLEPDYILNLWLKEVPPHTSEFLSLVLLDELIRQVTNGLSMSSVAHVRVKRVYLLTASIQSVAFIALLVLLKIGFQFWTIFYFNIGVSVILMIINLFFAHKYIDINLSIFVSKVILPSFLIGGITIAVMLYLRTRIFTSNINTPLGIMILSFIISTVLFIIFLLNREEKRKVMILTKELAFNVRLHKGIRLDK